MSTESKGIYHWKLGDVALAKVCQKAYARVRVVKDEKGLFYDDKVLGISGNEDGSITVTKELCYYVETCRTNHRFWLPYTSLHLAERSRPFYGTEKETSNDKNEVSNKSPAMLRKKMVKEDHIVPLEVKQSNKHPDLNTTHDKHQRHENPKESKCETAFKEFVRRGKEEIFDEYFEILKSNVGENNERFNNLIQDNASTEDKFEVVIKAVATEKEIDNHLHLCWKYNADVPVVECTVENKKELSDYTDTESPTMELVPVHTPWCLVCGKEGALRDCVTCPAAFHPSCQREWLLTIIHRKNCPNKYPKPVTFVDKILSSTRAKSVVREVAEKPECCPSCTWGPTVGYDDIVWNKLGSCGWWPARVLPPGEAPACLLARDHAEGDWPIKFYGSLEYSWAWGTATRTCLFLPSHTSLLASPTSDEDLKEAIMDANDDYITVYLT